MTEIIFKCQGTIDKYVGDMIMAFWGAPLRDTDHAKHAIQAALDMQAKTTEFHEYIKSKNLPEIKIGIGINSGIMSVGDMGSQYRRNYTVLGDNVNLASRVEGLTKYYGAHIIVTEATRQNQNNFIFRQLDRVRVKGKQTSINIFEVLCESNKLTPELEYELHEYHLALEAYFSQHFDNAYTIMEKLHIKHPHKKIYSVYTDRLTELKNNPPPKDWDGVYTHTAK
jgi:adenylate cyclase